MQHLGDLACAEHSREQAEWVFFLPLGHCCPWSSTWSSPPTNVNGPLRQITSHPSSMPLPRPGALHTCHPQTLAMELSRWE